MKISAILELWMDFSFQPLDRVQKVMHTFTISLVI